MAAVPATSAQSPQLGRFELRRILGKGAQATVYLGYDPRLDREVAVKLMRPAAGTDAAAVNQWMHEARAVSRLTHPHIVPVFEADMHGQQPYLVFEYVAGRTLSEHLKARGPLPAREAVQLVVGVLDALQAAHAAGVVHRDLKPSNILVDGAGRARVMDFGIAAHVKDGGNQKVVGTPGYMSPEAAHGEAPTPAMDVFSTALVLAEVLSGKPVIAERDAYRAIYRVAHEDLKLPGGLPSEVDDKLRAVLMRGMARDASQRHASAAKFRGDLQDWLDGTAGGGKAANAANGGANNNGTLEFLLRRMRHKSDFPAMSDSVVRIQRVATSEKESLGSLSNEILKDVALTNKLLRMVNTAHYQHAGGGSISTVSRAIALIGFAGIRNMALSLVLLEHMHDKSHANQLKEEFLRSLMAGSVATELCPVARESEEAFIGAMFQNLGRLLTEYYFPEEARQVRSVLADYAKSGRTYSAQTEEAASINVLGLSFEELGLGVAKSWGLPENLQRCMRTPTAEIPVKLADKPADRIRWLAQSANEITDALLRSEPGESAASIAQVAERYSKVLGVSSKVIEGAAVEARGKLAQMAQAMNIHVQPGTPASRLLHPTIDAVEKKEEEHDTLTPHTLQATITEDQSAMTPVDNAAEVMAAGIQDITNTMVETFKLNEVLRMILETMFRALGFRRVVFCLKDPRTEVLSGRFGLGDKSEQVAAAFKVSLKTPSDLFAAVCLKGADTLISDATVPTIATRLPAWYRQSVNAPAFLLLPLMIKGAPFALIYADKATPGGIELGERELSLLRTLRNQAVMAFKQAG
ncbi:serine/threonine protein kinase [Piscinibacter terrae]|uniref:Serine/threonine protein kinase n=1 Tax=Piscinibacter terrae TaxID=2496871 RepID=A0A3N7HN29_9BURK|nr:serine/threonine protein kinase [Albitalea terrae]RQP22071.1 serine/threonine protein kinase [Albitalea terrae]